MLCYGSGFKRHFLNKVTVSILKSKCYTSAVLKRVLYLELEWC